MSEASDTVVGLWNVMEARDWLAREIEKLAPATDRLAFPENAEYPWERGDKVFVPPLV